MIRHHLFQYKTEKKMFCLDIVHILPASLMSAMIHQGNSLLFRVYNTMILNSCSKALKCIEENRKRSYIYSQITTARLADNYISDLGKYVLTRIQQN